MMSQPDDITTTDHPNLRRLISLWYDGGITPSEFAKLQDLLKETPNSEACFGLTPKSNHDSQEMGR